MKINNAKLKELYQEKIKEKRPLKRNACPSYKDITKLLRNPEVLKNKLKLIDHITNCSYCAQEFEFVLMTSRYETNMQEIAQEIVKNKERRTFRSLRKSSPSLPFLRLSLKHASLLFSIATIALIISALVIYPWFENKNYRSIYPQPLKLSSPKGEKIPEQLLAFKWKSIKKAAYYRLEIFDETLYPIWTSDKIRANVLILPPKMERLLKNGRVYYWMVTAYLPDEEKIESYLEEFSIKK